MTVDTSIVCVFLTAVLAGQGWLIVTVVTLKEDVASLTQQMKDQIR